MKICKTICLLLLVNSFLSIIKAQERKVELIVQTGHASGISAATFSPDGKVFASGGYDGKIRFWNITTGQELRAVSAYGLSVTSVAFSPDGKTLASAGHSNRTDETTSLTTDEYSIKLWSVASGQELLSFSKQESVPINSVAFSPDGKKIASAGSDKTVKFWNASGREIKIFAKRDSWIHSIAFSPDGKLLAAAGGDGESKDYTIAVWEISSGKKIKTLAGHTEWTTSVAFSSDSKQILSQGLDNKLKLWDVAQGREIKETPFGGLFTISADNKKIGVVRSDKIISILDGASGQQISMLDARAFFAEAFAISPDGKIIASSGNGRIRLWNIASGKEVKSIKAHSNVITSMAFSPDSKMLVSGSKDDTIKLWDLATGRELMSGSHEDNVNAAAFSWDGKFLASGSDDRTIKIWSIETGREIGILNGHTDFVNAVAFSHDGKMLVSGGDDNIVRLWDVATKKEIKSFTKFEFSGKKKSHIFSVEAVAFSPDGTKAASKDLGGEIILWDTTSGKDLKYISSLKTEISKKSESEVDLKFIRENNKNFLRGLFADVPDFRRVFGITNDGKFQITKSAFNRLDLFEYETEKLLISLIPLGEDDWLAVTSEGFFDGTPTAWKQLIWRFDNDTFNYAPVEAFFKEFYYPGLLQEIMQGKTSAAPAKDLSAIDIRQPVVKISAIDDRTVNFADNLSAEKQTVKVRVEIEDNSNEGRRSNFPSSSGANDLRLFRNGSLVRLWKKKGAASDKTSSVFELTKEDGCTQMAASGNAPRKAVCETDVAITAGANNLTAYAFNHDDVKSTDAPPVNVEGKFPKRDGTLYVLAIGVNKYANTKYNLNYAVKYVTEIGKTLQEQQAKLGNLRQYAKTEVVTLTDELATKENILTALKSFAGADVGNSENALPQNASEKLVAELSKIKPTQPEDALLIYYAGHGISKKQRFYLIPHNFTGEAARFEADTVSDLELNDYLEKVDAGKLLMVIDACQSGQALGGKNDGKAPMNSKGFAQLAYDKGMYILTAAQSQQAALEAVRIGDKTIENGLLTHTLLQAFINDDADKDANRQLWETEWFDFAVEQVPLFQREAMKQRSLDLKSNDPKIKVRSDLAYIEHEENLPVEARNVQTPRVFYRREADNRFLIVANRQNK